MKEILNKKIFKLRSSSGFTLVETLVALSILLVGLTAAMSASQVGLGTISTVRNRITGMYLAQEAMEGVKNIKDTNLLAGREWLYGIIEGDTNCSAGESCAYDLEGGEKQHGVLFNGDNKIRIDRNTSLFRQKVSPDPVNDTDTGFVREVVVEETIPNKEALVRVMITMPGGRYTPFEVSEYLYKFF